MKKRRRNVLWVLVLPILALFSCAKDKDMHFGVASATRIELGANDTSAEIRIEASGNVSWAITDFPQWIRPDAVTGNGDRRVMLTVRPNDTGAQRTGTLLVGSMLGEVRITVVQQAR